MRLTRRHAAAAVAAVFVLTGITLVASHQLGGKKVSAITNYWVATTGSDSNNGLSPAGAWLTVNKAGQTVTAGAVVHVANGTYSTPVSIANSGTAQSHIVFQSDNTWGASVQGGASYGFTILGDYVDLRGFDVTATTAVVAVAVEGNNDRILYNHVHNVNSTGTCQSSGGAIDAFPQAGYPAANAVVIEGNKVDTVNQATCYPANFTHGIYTTSAGSQVVNNIVGNVYGYGIHCWHACNAPITANNTVFNCAQGGIVAGTGDSGVVNQFDYAVMTNNISINNGAYGLREYSYDAAHMGTHNTWLNNHTFGNTTGSFLSDYSKNVDSGTKTTNPSFVNYQANASGDYHLTVGADDIDTGTNTAMPQYDYSGVPRDNPPDIGAYEVINS